MKISMRIPVLVFEKVGDRQDLLTTVKSAQSLPEGAYFENVGDTLYQVGMV